MKYLKPKLFFVFALALCLCAPAVAQDETVNVSEEISTIKQSLRDKISELTDEYKSADDAEARASVVKKRRTMESDHVQQLINVLEKRDDERRNIRDLVWFINRIKGEARAQVYGELVPKYVKSKYMSELVRALGKVSSPSPENELWLKELIEKSPIEKVQGNAVWTYVEYLEKLQEATSVYQPLLLDLFEKDGTEIKPTDLAKDVDKSDLPKLQVLWASLNGRDEGALNNEIEKLLITCRDKYADVKKGRNAIGKLAASKLNLSNLKVGKIAPDIVGKDLDGVEFKLSDYRGKVVMIDFWGDW